MEAAVRPMRHFDRTWQLLAVAVLLAVLAIGGAAGYVIRLATAPAATLTNVAPPPAQASSLANGSGAQVVTCPKLPDLPKGVTC